jgi:hypothetical protein
MVSYAGRRIVFFGRTAETHVEPFPIPDQGELSGETP